MQSSQPRPLHGRGTPATVAASLGGADNLHLAAASTRKPSVNTEGTSSATNAKEDDADEGEDEEDGTPPPQQPKKPSSRFTPAGDRCQRCILQRKGCDGVKPVCGNCSRRTRATGGPCVYPQGNPSRRELSKMNDQQGNAVGAGPQGSNNNDNNNTPLNEGDLTSVSPHQALLSGQQANNTPANPFSMEDGRQIGNMPLNPLDIAAAEDFDPSPQFGQQIGNMPFNTYHHQGAQFGQQIGNMPQNDYLIAAAAPPHLTPQSGIPQGSFAPFFHPQGPSTDMQPPQRLQAPGLRQQGQTLFTQALDLRQQGQTLYTQPTGLRQQGQTYYTQPPPLWNPRPNAQPRRRSRSPPPIYTTMSPASVRAGQFPIRARPAVDGGAAMQLARGLQALRERPQSAVAVATAADAPVIPTGGTSNRASVSMLPPTPLPTLNWGPHYIGDAVLNPYPPHGVCSGPHMLTRQLPEAVRPEEPLEAFEEGDEEEEMEEEQEEDQHEDWLA